MAYCTPDQVENLMQVKFTSASKPSMEKVTELVYEIAGEMDGVIEAAGYTLPITSASALALLRRYNTYGVAASAWHAGYITDSDMPRVAYWQQEYKDFLARLRRYEQLLPGESSENDDIDDPAFAIAGFAGMADING